MLLDVGGWGEEEGEAGGEGGGLVSVLDVSLFYFIKENWDFCLITKHQAEPDINILLTRNLPFESDYETLL